jgi:uncharacterized protein (TIGR03437 family)
MYTAGLIIRCFWVVRAVHHSVLRLLFACAGQLAIEFLETPDTNLLWPSVRAAFMNTRLSINSAPALWLIGVTALFAPALSTAQTYTISTFAGGGNPSLGGQGLAVDASGNLYIADTSNNVIRKVTPTGIISTVAGNTVQQQGYYGDGGLATSAGLNQPYGVAVDSAGDLFIADFGNQRIRKVSTNGIITTLAGGGSALSSGGPATQAALPGPVAVAVDVSGNIFVADQNFSRVFKITPDGTIAIFAGNGLGSSPAGGDGGPATSASLNAVGLAVDTNGNLFVADSFHNRIRKVSPNGIVTTVAGSNSSNFSGDGGPATSAGLNMPSGITVDAAGDLFIADSGNYRIREVTPDNTITTIAGNGIPGFSGDGGPATSAMLDKLKAIVIGNGGPIYITDVRNTDFRGFIRVLTPATSMGLPVIKAGGIVPIYSSTGTIQLGSWISIFGNNLAAAATTWNNDFPTMLGGTTVVINNKAAYLWYVSPTQINLQAPDDTARGVVSVEVTTSGGSVTSTVTLGPFGPSFSVLDGKHVAGIILRSDGSGAYGGGTYDIVGPTGTSLGYKTVAAKAGDVLELFGVGFGPTNPAVPAGQAYSGSAPTTNSVQLSINNVAVTAGFAGITSAGLYQVNILKLPTGLGTGDVPLRALVGAVQTPTGVVLSVQ